MQNRFTSITIPWLHVFRGLMVTLGLVNTLVLTLHIWIPVTSSEMSRQGILNYLLYNGSYDSSIAPDFEKNVPTNITVQILVQNIYSVSETSMDYSVDIFLRQYWMDSRLQFQNLSGSSWLELDNKMMDKVWTPDTFFPNEKEAHAHTVTIPNRMIHVYQNGTVLYSMRLSLTLSCSMLLQKYPLDEQRCPINIESYGYSIGNINYMWSPLEPVVLSSNVEMPQFRHATGPRFVECKKVYGEVGQFSCLSAEVVLQRKVGYYIVQIFVPSILIVVLSWVSFWVDHDAVPARVSLGIMTVLTMTTQSSGTRLSLPQVSYIKAIDIWMASCLLFVFAALLEYAYVNVTARRRPPQRCVYVQHETSAIEIVEFKRNGSSHTDRIAKIHRDGNSLARRIDKGARVIFPASFLVFNVVFWIYYQEFA